MPLAFVHALVGVLQAPPVRDDTMPNAFSLHRSRCAVLSELREEIQAHTGNEAATSSILRSIQRFGDDASVRRYEMTPHVRGRGPRAVAWNVHAVRN